MQYDDKLIYNNVCTYVLFLSDLPQLIFLATTFIYLL